jgi:hypothetical protein
MEEDSVNTIALGSLRGVVNSQRLALVVREDRG